jgi:CRISPR system Cascade subunit CasC
MQQLDAKHSTRTRELGVHLKQELIDGGVEEKKAIELATKMAGCFGKLKSKELTHEENVVYGHEEWGNAIDLARSLASNGRDITDTELDQLQRPTTSLDVALFGRMRAAEPALNVDASVSVSQLVSTHGVVIESDNWTALDDLNPVGSAGMGEIEFASAVVYGFIIIDLDSLIENLSGNSDLARDASAALIKIAARVSPSAMNSRFAQETLPSYFRVEAGDVLYNHEAAFNKPVVGEDLITDSIALLKEHAENSYKAYSIAAKTWEVSADNSLNDVVGQVMEAILT